MAVAQSRERGTPLSDVVNAPGREQKMREIRKIIDEKGIKYIYFQLISVSGRVNGKGIPAHLFEKTCEAGFQLVYGATADLFIDRNNRYIGFGPEESELVAIPDLDTFAILPWDAEVARFFCDCYDTETGAPLDSDPRGNLKRVLDNVESELGYQMLCGIEPEMMWLRYADGKLEGLTRPYCYHIDQFETLRPIIRDVIAYATSMGIEMIHGDHEDAPGQLELNIRHDRPLRTADNITTYRQICAAVAKKHGVIACFMPKPFKGVSANGHHHHFTFVDRNGNNVFFDPSRPAGLSDIARHFLGGILEHLRALTAITAPTVNSYKRFWDTGYWAPVYRNWGWQNRTCGVRVSAKGRFEYRAVDSSCNPYLTQAALLVAGADGVRRKLDPGDPQEANTYDLLAQGKEFERVPGTLGEALDALEADPVVRSALPGRLFDVFMHYKRDEWERYCAEVTDWDLKTYVNYLP